jgi:methionyl-tRNA formyltransferase
MNYVLATSRSWNAVMATQLAEKTGHEFHLITGKQDLTKEYLTRIQPRYVFFPHWSWIIPENIHQRFECVVFHMTDLPYGRGGSPLQNLIQQGYKDTKISALRSVRELDAGPVYGKQHLCLEGSASEIFLRADAVIKTMILHIVENEPEPVPQEGTPVYFSRRKPEMSDLSETTVNTVSDFFDFIRMLDAEGYPKAFLDLHGHRMEFSRVQREQDRLVGTFTVYKKT